MENIWLVQSTKRLFSPWQLTLEVKRWQEGAASSNINIFLSPHFERKYHKHPAASSGSRLCRKPLMSKVRRCRFGQSRKYLPSNQSCQLYGHESLLLRLSLNLVGCRFRITFVGSNNWISHSLTIYLSHTLGYHALHWILSAPLFCCSQFPSSQYCELTAQTGLTCVMCDQCTLVSPPTLTGDPGQATAECEPRLAPAPAWELPSASLPSSITTLPISVMVNSKQIQASPLSGSNTFLLLCCINSCHRIIRSDDGWWRLYWIRFREGEGRRAVLSVLLLWYSEAPSSQTLVTIEAGGSLCAALHSVLRLLTWHLTMLWHRTDADLAPGASLTLIRVTDSIDLWSDTHVSKLGLGQSFETVCLFCPWCCTTYIGKYCKSFQSIIFLILRSLGKLR